MTRPDPRWVAFQAGFNLSGEGWNAEYQRGTVSPKKLKRILRKEYVQWLKTQPKSNRRPFGSGDGEGNCI